MAGSAPYAYTLEAPDLEAGVRFCTDAGLKAEVVAGAQPVSTRCVGLRAITVWAAPRALPRRSIASSVQRPAPSSARPPRPTA